MFSFLTQLLMPSLNILGKKYNCDKFTVHNFAPAYESHLSHLRWKKIRLLEIGVGEEGSKSGGASLKTWNDYFLRAEIIGLDIFDKSFLDSGRMRTIQIDQSDQVSMDAMAASNGPFDVVIDDGSHMSIDTLRAFFILFNHVAVGGYYVIEDIQTGYWPSYGGTSVAQAFEENIISWLKTLVDVVNVNEILWDRHLAKKTGFVIESVHFYRNIVFIKKGSKAEPSNVISDLSLRSQWLLNDFDVHRITPEFSEEFDESPELRRDVLKVAQELRAKKREG